MKKCTNFQWVDLPMRDTVVHGQFSFFLSCIISAYNWRLRSKIFSYCCRPEVWEVSIFLESSVSTCNSSFTAELIFSLSYILSFTKSFGFCYGFPISSFKVALSSKHTSRLTAKAAENGYNRKPPEKIRVELDTPGCHFLSLLGETSKNRAWPIVRKKKVIEALSADSLLSSRT